MKKVLSILLSLTVLMSSFAMSSVALASDSVKVEYSVSADGKFLMEPTVLTVTADLSDKYGYEDSCKTVSILDATIAAHIKMFGTDKVKINEKLVVAGGWTTAAFGKETGALSYRLNGGMDDGKGNYYNYNTAVTTGDYVEYMFYQDDSYYSDVYTAFDTRSKTINAGESVTLSLKAEEYGPAPDYALTMANAKGVTITVDGKEFGKTDENGNIAIKFNDYGEHIVSAIGDYGYGKIFAPYCKVTVKNHLGEHIKESMASAMTFLMRDAKSFDINSANDYLTYLDSGYDMSSFKSAFLKSVKDNLTANKGKLLNMAGKEDLGLYGAVIQILDRYGMDAKNVYGYNIVSAFESLPADQISNPYLYRVAIKSASSTFAKSLCDALIKDYYVMGKGMNYWGFSCDSTAVFLTAIAPYANDYKAVVDDAKSVIASYTATDGCFFSSEYPESNADSTAVALMAYAALGNNAKALDLFAKLKNFESTTLGVMLSYGAMNDYATKEAVLALEYFNASIKATGFDGHPVRSTVTQPATTSKNGTISKICVICGTTTSTSTIAKIKTVTLSKTAYTYTGKTFKPSVKVVDSNGKTVSSKYYTVKQSKRTSIGTATVTITMKDRYSGTIKKTFVINPKKPTGVSVKGASKKFTVKWKKNAEKVTGYQIKYKKGSAKATTVSTTKLTKTVSKLKKGKYTVQIRAYKTVDGKKYYSSWTTAKKVTVK